MRGYHGRSREDCFDADGWFHTGDLVRTDSDGLFYFLGRAGSMIKTAGANVSPAEVERALTRVTGCTAFVVGLADSERGQIVAAVVATDGSGRIRRARGACCIACGPVGVQDPRRFVPVLPHEVSLVVER